MEDEILAHRGNNPTAVASAVTAAEKESKKTLAITLVSERVKPTAIPVPDAPAAVDTGGMLTDVAAAALAQNLLRWAPYAGR